jgi:hypothetical protein
LYYNSSANIRLSLVQSDLKKLTVSGSYSLAFILMMLCLGSCSFPVKTLAIAGMLLMGNALGGAGLSAAESGAVIGFTQGTLNSANLGEGVKQGVISGITYTKTPSPPEQPHPQNYHPLLWRRAHLQSL